MNFKDFMENNYEGAGFAFLTPDNRILMLQKPNKKWSLVGGHSEKGEQPFKTAKRECKEEIGFYPDGKIFDMKKYLKRETQKDCYIFLMRVKKPFKPKLSSEHVAFDWVPFDKVSSLNLSKAVRDAFPFIDNSLENTLSND